jgi:hypothetical protein
MSLPRRREPIHEVRRRSAKSRRHYQPNTLCFRSKWNRRPVYALCVPSPHKTSLLDLLAAAIRPGEGRTNPPDLDSGMQPEFLTVQKMNSPSCS